MRKNIYKQYIIASIVLLAVSLISTIWCIADASQINNNMPSIIETKIDLKFIHQEEGETLKAYVPLPAKSKSGVTVGHGFDLGQINQYELDSMDLDKSLKEKLKPYVGLKKHNAEEYLKQNPLDITCKELNEIDLSAKNKILSSLIKNYDQESIIDFTDLPAEAQTAIFSYAYQYGPNTFYSRAKSKVLWTYLIIQDWSEASEYLKKAKKYHQRRAKEASLLSELV